MRFLSLSRTAGVAMAAVLVMAGSSSLSAQTSTGAAGEQQSFTSEQLHAAQRAIDASKATEGFDQILPTLAEQTQGLFTRSYPALTAQIEEVTTQVAIEMAQRRPQLDRTIQEIWARRFTVEELNEIAAFYTSPIGEKVADLSPSISALSVGASKQWADALSTEMVEEVRRRMQAQGAPL
jgi:hypothetical protein